MTKVEIGIVDLETGVRRDGYITAPTKLDSRLLNVASITYRRVFGGTRSTPTTSA